MFFPENEAGESLKTSYLVFCEAKDELKIRPQKRKTKLKNAQTKLRKGKTKLRKGKTKLRFEGISGLVHALAAGLAPWVRPHPAPEQGPWLAALRSCAAVIVGRGTTTSFMLLSLRSVRPQSQELRIVAVLAVML